MEFDPVFEPVGESQSSSSTLFCDWYEVTMAYAYWKAGNSDKQAVFEAFFRKCPFQGQFAVFCGREGVYQALKRFRFGESEINFVKRHLKGVPSDSGFYDWLRLKVTPDAVRVLSCEEGRLVFPNQPVLVLEGPLAVCQLLETLILNSINFATLVATNAARMRLAAGPNKKLLEFGLRRAQGPNGGLTASRSAFVGGFDATSNVKAAHLYGIPLAGTHAHSFVTCFNSLDAVSSEYPAESNCPKKMGYKELALNYRSQILPLLRDVQNLTPVGHRRDSNESLDGGKESDKGSQSEESEMPHVSLGACSSPLRAAAYEPNDGELAAFLAFSQALPNEVTALIDTYDVIHSGLPNFLAVALALEDAGHRVKGVRLDSGDMAYLSRVVRNGAILVASAFQRPWLAHINICASNDLNEMVLHGFNDETNEIDIYGIGTNLVTCQAQPSLGMVLKLVELEGQPCLKLSSDIEKISLPYRKNLYRLLSSTGMPLADIMTMASRDPKPQPGDTVFCQHAMAYSKRCNVIPKRVECLLKPLVFNGNDEVTEGDISSISTPTDPQEDEFAILKAAQKRCLTDLERFRSDHLRHVNPTPYKVSVSKEYSTNFRELLLSLSPVPTYS